MSEAAIERRVQKLETRTDSNREDIDAALQTLYQLRRMVLTMQGTVDGAVYDLREIKDVVDGAVSDVREIKGVVDGAVSDVREIKESQADHGALLRQILDRLDGGQGGA